MPTRHRWTKDELTHLNRVVGSSPNKTAAFKKVAEEMDLEWTTVRSTYNNHHRKADKPKVEQTSIFKDVNDEDLIHFAKDIHAEVDRRRQLIESLKELYAGH